MFKDIRPGDGVLRWIADTSDGDVDLEQWLAEACRRFFRRHGCVLIESAAPEWHCLARIGRAAIAIAAGGMVRSTELFHVPDLEAFDENEAERHYVLAATSWDDRAAVFTPHPPPRGTRDQPSLLDWDGKIYLESSNDQARQFEYYLNADLRGYSPAGRLFEAPGAEAPEGHRRLSQVRREAFKAAFVADQAPVVAQVLHHFRERLDPASLKAIEQAAANSVRSYNWLAGHDRRSKGLGAGKMRLQAVAAYPLAWPLVSAPFGSVSDAVRESKPLNPVLAEAWDVPVPTLRKMNGLTAAAAGMRQPDRVKAAAIAHKVDMMPAGTTPVTELGWTAYFTAADLAVQVSALMHDPGQVPIVLATGASRWDKLDETALFQALAGIEHLLADVHDNLFAPVMRAQASGWSQLSTARALFTGVKLAEICKMSSRWHADQAGIHARLSEQFPLAGRGKESNSWEPLHSDGPWTAPNGLQVTPLTTKTHLTDEHNRMAHCVNIYTSACLFGGSHILSIRRPGMRTPLGTAEIRQEVLLPLVGKLMSLPDAPLQSLPPGVVQFKAARNAMPDMEAWQALWAYMGAIFKGGLKLETKRLEEDLAVRRRFSDPTLLSYDERAPGALQAAWNFYAPCLPPKLVKRGPEGLIEVARPRAPNTKTPHQAIR